MTTLTKVCLHCCPLHGHCMILYWTWDYKVIKFCMTIMFAPHCIQIGPVDRGGRQPPILSSSLVCSWILLGLRCIGSSYWHLQLCVSWRKPSDLTLLDSVGWCKHVSLHKTFSRICCLYIKLVLINLPMRAHTHTHTHTHSNLVLHYSWLH